VIIYNP